MPSPLEQYDQQRASRATKARTLRRPVIQLPVSEWPMSDRARELAHALLQVGDSAAERQAAATACVNELNECLVLPPCPVTVADRAQVHSHDGQRLQSKTYGYYRCWSEGSHVERSRIRIYHLTAVRKRVISPKVFLNTLLHEWTHHIDFAGLHRKSSPHNVAFFKRLREVAERLGIGFVMPPDPDAIAGPPRAPSRR